jgi:hypothetical protein
MHYRSVGRGDEAREAEGDPGLAANLATSPGKAITICDGLVSQVPAGYG